MGRRMRQASRLGTGPPGSETEGEGDPCLHMEEMLRLCPRIASTMSRQHTRHGRIVYVFPDDFPERLERFKEESGLSWAEVARRIHAGGEW